MVNVQLKLGNYFFSSSTKILCCKLTPSALKWFDIHIKLY